MIDWTKPIETVKGLKAKYQRHLKTSSGDRVLVVVTDEDGIDAPITYTAEGKYWHDNTPHHLDIHNVRVKHKRKVWINCYPTDFLYPTGLSYLYESRDLADKWAMAIKRIACIEREIEFTEGEGL